MTRNVRFGAVLASVSLLLSLMTGCTQSNEAPYRPFFDPNVASLPTNNGSLNSTYHITVDKTKDKIVSGAISWYPVVLSDDSPLLADTKSTLTDLNSEAYAKATADFSEDKIKQGYELAVRYIIQEYFASELLWEADASARARFAIRQASLPYFPKKEDGKTASHDGKSLDWYTVYLRTLDHGDSYCSSAPAWNACLVDQDIDNWRGPGLSAFDESAKVTPIDPLDMPPFELMEFKPESFNYYAADDNGSASMWFRVHVVYILRVTVSEKTGNTVSATQWNSRSIEINVWNTGDHFQVGVHTASVSADTSTPQLIRRLGDAASLEPHAPAMPFAIPTITGTSVDLCHATLTMRPEWKLVTDPTKIPTSPWSGATNRALSYIDGEGTTRTLEAHCWPAGASSTEQNPTYALRPGDTVYSLSAGGISGIVRVGEYKVAGADPWAGIRIEAADDQGWHYQIIVNTSSSQALELAAQIVVGLAPNSKG